MRRFSGGHASAGRPAEAGEKKFKRAGNEVDFTGRMT
jgi:hypothetical protein